MTTETIHPVKFKPGIGSGEYTVSLNGDVIGTVQRREKRYNLRRLIVDKFWTVSGRGLAVDFVRVRQEVTGGPVRFQTRSEAAQALAAYAVSHAKAKADAERGKWDGFESQRDLLAATIYNVRSQSPREMTPERWATIKDRFAGSARECLEQADTELEDM